ncbi:MAG: metal-dependent transcriptional regulator [Deltaproteobacteria bacterium]|nr:metal-dependent transcriptional regulator [Deltaproteobacteria bacterium]
MVEVWKEFEANELTHSMAHYLMAVRDLLSEQGYARMTDIARKLNIACSSVSIAIRALAEKGFVKEDQNKFIRLTDKGRRIADEILGKKIILRRFLEDILHVKPHQAEVDTCKIEHLISSETGAKLLSFLKFMTSDNELVVRVLKAFWGHREACEGIGKCAVCFDTCLKEMMPLEFPKRANG